MSLEPETTGSRLIFLHVSHFGTSAIYLCDNSKRLDAMDKAIYPELSYRIFIRCTNPDLTRKVVQYASEFSHWYDSIEESEEGVTFQTSSFTNIQCVISFYKSAVSVVDDIPFDDVCEDAHLGYISLEIEYVSGYWANRCLREIMTAIAQCGPSCTLSSPRIDGNVVSVVCTSWDALFNLDRLIMNAGHGYSTHQDCQKSNVPTASEVKSDKKPLLVFGACMAAVVLLLICLV